MNPEHRRQLARLARRKRTRRVPDLPCRWRPETVMNPENNQPFTEDGAWEFIAQRLEDLGQSLEEIVLQVPPGEPGFEIVCPLPTGIVYIKFHSDRGCRTILGRSFHYSGE
jgi:hypothetical protein